jgi:signal transduction histidine kinase
VSDDPPGSDDSPAHGRTSRLRVSQWFTAATVAVALVTVVGIVVGVVAIVRLADQRNLVVDQLDPAALEAQRLTNALVNEESGVRGYVLGGDETFLQPYRVGRSQEQRALEALREHVEAIADERLTADLAAVERHARVWRTRYAEPTIARVSAEGSGAIGKAGIERGRRLFDRVRVALLREEVDIARAREEGRADFRDAATFLSVAFGLIALLVVAALATTMIMLRRTVTVPIETLARRVRRVASGQFDAPIRGAGPSDIAAFAADVESMRQRIVDELDALREAHERLDAQARDLARSNAELEQFAYVASHDLQEPLRKVASFCQLLERRYKGQLDERADQYIDFAVDGAKRMQQLINDLLAFSRVGRTSGAELAPTPLGAVVERALADLESALAESDAAVEVGELPTVRGDASLLALVFQNLIGNAVKFRSDAALVVRIAAERDGDEWTISCSDNGIGIDAEYAERVFVIFQRLHPKDEYAGTGIGLAMCRKIVEHHGGRIWLDPDGGPGTTFRFTLPALEEIR